MTFNVAKKPRELSAEYVRFKRDVNSVQSDAAKEKHRNDSAGYIAQEAMKLANNYGDLLKRNDWEGVSATRSLNILTGNTSVNNPMPVLPVSSRALDQPLAVEQADGEWWVWTRLREVKDATVAIAYTGAESIGNMAYQGAAILHLRATPSENIESDKQNSIVEEKKG